MLHQESLKCAVVGERCKPWFSEPAIHEDNSWDRKARTNHSETRGEEQQAGKRWCLFFFCFLFVFLLAFAKNFFRINVYSVSQVSF